VLRTPIKAPRANAICERLLRSIRRERLDHILILSEGHLRRLLKEYMTYFNWARPHQGINQRVPELKEKANPTGENVGKVIALPILGGLHHEYRRAA
jgi:putative transposase